MVGESSRPGLDPVDHPAVAILGPGLLDGVQRLHHPRKVATAGARETIAACWSFDLRGATPGRSNAYISRVRVKLLSGGPSFELAKLARMDIRS